MAVAASVAGSHVSPQVCSYPKATDECPLSLQHAVGRAFSPKGELLRAPPIVSRGLAPLAGKGRASARAATGDGRSVDGQPSTETSEAARFRSLAGGLPSVSFAGLRKGSRDCPGYGTTWQGVSLAGRVRDCEVRARVLYCEDRQQRAPAKAGCSVERLRQRRASSAAGRCREATKGPLPKVKSASGPGGTGSQADRSSLPP